MSQEMGFDCPACGPGVLLGPASGPLQARTCPRCRGALLGPQEARRLLELAGSPPVAPARPGAPLPCPSCGAPLPRLDLGGTPFAPCASCGAAWMEPPARAAPPASAADRGARPARSRAPAIAAGAAAAVAAIAAAYALRAPAPRPPPVQVARPAPAPAPQAPEVVAAAPAVAPPAAPKAARAPLLLAPAAELRPVEALPPAAGGPQVILAPRPGSTATVVIHFASGAVDDRLPGSTRLAQQALLAANTRLDARRFTADVHAAGALLEITFT